MKSKKSSRRTGPPREREPPPASDRLIEAMQGAVNRARAKKLVRDSEPSTQHLNPFAGIPKMRAVRVIMIDVKPIVFSAAPGYSG